MRYGNSKKHEIFPTVEDSSLKFARTLRHLTIPKSRFYHWYDHYLTSGLEELEDQKPSSAASWNQAPEEIRHALMERALDLPNLSPWVLAVRFTDESCYFISEATIYGILKEHDLVTSPAWTVLKPADQFQHPTTAINQLWKTELPTRR